MAVCVTLFSVMYCRCYILLSRSKVDAFGLGRWSTVEREAQVRGSDPEVLKGHTWGCLNKWTWLSKEFHFFMHQLSAGRSAKHARTPCEQSIGVLSSFLWRQNSGTWVSFHDTCAHYLMTFHCKGGLNRLSHQYEELCENKEFGFPHASRTFSDLYLVHGTG